jgi:hypothetical protein
MIILVIRSFCNLDILKKGIAILCLTALILSASSISYFYWVEEKLHEQEVFAKIDAGKFEQESHNEVTHDDKSNSVKLVLKEKDQLPEGYTWEEEGREFSHEGMFYDIVSLKKTDKGWELVAASDEEEAAIVANQKTSKKEGYHFKLTRIQFVFIAPVIVKQDLHFILNQTSYTSFKASLFNRSLIKFSPPPEVI